MMFTDWVTAVLTAVVLVALIYLSLVMLMLIRPRLMSWLLFSHWLKNVPYATLAPKLSDLEFQRMASFARNIEIPTPDGIIIRGWHVLNPGHDAVRASELSDNKAERERVFDAALGRLCDHDNSSVSSCSLQNLSPLRRIILFFHGSALDRSWPNRVALVQFLAAQLGAQVLAIDPRGFGDSEGFPSEAGFAIDAESVFRWLCGASSSEAKLDESCFLPPNTHLILYGQSLGTAIVTRLAQELSSRNRPVSALILDAPFTTMADALLDHPGAAPFRILPARIWNELISRLPEKFLTKHRIAGVECPVLLVHGTDDEKIGVAQGRELFKAAKAAGVRIYMHEFRGAHHADCFGHPEYLAVVEKFLSQIC